MNAQPGPDFEMSNEVEEIYEEDFDSDGGHKFEEVVENEGKDVVECSDVFKPDETAKVASIS